MKPQDVLKLAVRILGLVFLYHGLETLPPAVIQFFAAVSSNSFGTILAGLLMVGWPLAVACWLLRGAPLIMRIAYPETPAGPKEETRIGGAIAHKDG